jgi:hypothetical protein
MADSLRGVVVHVATAGYCFVSVDDRHTFFIHKSDFLNLAPNEYPRRNDVVVFEEGVNKRGPCGRRARIVRPQEPKPKGLETLANELAKKGGVEEGV